jgi:hypothetical protein
MRHSESAAGSDNANHTFFWKRQIRTAEVTEIFAPDAYNGVSHRSEIIDQSEAIDSQALGDHGWPNDPMIVRQLQHFARYRAGYGYGRRTGQRMAKLLSEGLPGSLQTGMFYGVERNCFIQARDLTAFNFGKREAGMAAADISRN